MSRAIRCGLGICFTVGVSLWLLSADVVTAQESDVSPTGWRRQNVCPPGTVPVYPSQAAPAEAPQPGATEANPAQALPPEAAAPSSSDLAGGLGAAAGPMGAPNMVGDLPGTRIIDVHFFINSTERGSTRIEVPVAGGAGIYKMSENNSPLPTDRVFFDYNHYQDALNFTPTPGTPTALNLDTYEFGLEKTFFDGMCSLEFRIPFASGLSADQTDLAASPVTGTEFGDIPIVFKTLIFQGEQNTFSAGLATVLPTARDVTVTDPEIKIKNQTIHLQPFIGWLWQPSDRMFFQAFVAVDFGTRGDDVFSGATFAGTLNDQPLLFLDSKVGYWLYQDPEARWVKGIAPTVELHYTSTLQNANSVGTLITPAFLNQNILDMTAGLQFRLGKSSDFTVAGAIPLSTSPADKLFDAEVIAQYNWRF
ncbi:MAG: hypothetical protein ACLQNE_07870 [Thermoguttaceae bacterium]